ncbi:glycosyltransferase family 4 protein [Flavobacterium sp. LB1P62]|uniref:glycosyltransferase family 4 protein n=1 Tax=Flavobacterium sp. LB1P62 TaxID=3401715 RepID=UPI003AABCC5A
MKTILIAHNYSEVSFSAMSYNLAHHLATLGHQVIFVSHQPYFFEDRVVKKENGEISICSWPTTERPTLIRDFIWYVSIYFKYKPDVIIGHFVGSNISVSVSKLLSFGKVKTFEYYHTLTDQLLTDIKKTSIQQKLLFFRKKIFYNLFCDVIVCPSALAKKDLQDFYLIDKGLVMLNPIKDRFESKIAIDEAKITISYLGRLDPSKGVIDLITAFTAYKNKVPSSKIILNIAGTGSQELEVKEIIKDNLAICYLGGLPYQAIDDYLNKSHFVIIPSKYDNLPTVGLESMMNQTPLLISNTIGLASYLIEGKECFKFEPNVDSMISLFDKIENSFNLCEQMSFDARATFLEKFGMDTYCNSISNMIL